MQPLGMRQSEVVGILAEHGGALALANLHAALPRPIALRDLVQVIRRLGKLRIVKVTPRSRDRRGDLIALRVRLVDAP